MKSRTSKTVKGPASKKASTKKTASSLAEPQRLGIRRDTLRRLYLHSGNRCAFPKCKETMMDEKGNFVGEVCHIEAAKRGGERFRDEMSDEERRSFTNLLLLCHRHHVVTDDVKQYTVAKLQRMKAAHERKFSQIEEKMSATISDESLETQSSDPTTLVGLLGKVNEDRPGEVRRVKKYASRLRELPVETRQFFCVAVRRAYEQALRERDIDGLGLSTVNPVEVQKATRLSFDEVREQVRILDQHSLAYVDDDDGTGTWTMYIRGQGSWHRLPEDIAGFCKKQDISLEEVFVELRFDLLDGTGE